MNYSNRIALIEDIDAIDCGLPIKPALFISTEQLEASFDSMGLDDQLIKDKTYFLIFREKKLVGCGGWSNRKTLFGANHTPNRDETFLNPITDSARIRAMYTHPDWARKGIGSLVMQLAEGEAKKAGFKKCELMATQSGKLLYETQGYESIEDILQKSVRTNGTDDKNGKEDLNMKEIQLNVYGEEIKECSCSPMTGFFRTGCCETSDQDQGSHTVCTVLTDKFLEFSFKQGNDLVTPVPAASFPGLVAGDHWCLCAPRWQEALEHGCAPMVVLSSTHEKALEYIDLIDLKKYAVDLA